MDWKRIAKNTNYTYRFTPIQVVPHPFANSPLTPLLLLTLTRQRIAPKTKTTFKDEYDYVIVGAGAGGSVVASRLSEECCVSVLVLEAGKAGPQLSDIPGIARYFVNSELDWKYKTEPQKYTGSAHINRVGLFPKRKYIVEPLFRVSTLFASSHNVYLVRLFPKRKYIVEPQYRLSYLKEPLYHQALWSSGKGLGGSSLFNGLIFSRGNPKNYDDWAAQGAIGWSFREVWPYFLKQEDNWDLDFVANGLPLDTKNPAKLPFRWWSRNCPKTKIRFGNKRPVLEAARRFGYRYGDPNGARQTGFADMQGTMGDGQRCNDAEDYLVPAENRTNLDILTNAFVTKIIMEGNQAVGVQFVRKGTPCVVKARREVIVSAGVTNTPKLLMLSGIGPREHLEKFGIPVVADLPVGNNLQDHPLSSLGFKVDPRIPTMTQKLQDPRNIKEFIANRIEAAVHTIQQKTCPVQPPKGKSSPKKFGKLPLKKNILLQAVKVVTVGAKSFLWACEGGYQRPSSIIPWNCTLKLKMAPKPNPDLLKPLKRRVKEDTNAPVRFFTEAVRSNLNGTKTNADLLKALKRIFCFRRLKSFLWACEGGYQRPSSIIHWGCPLTSMEFISAYAFLNTKSDFPVVDFPDYQMKFVEFPKEFTITQYNLKPERNTSFESFESTRPRKSNKGSWKNRKFYTSLQPLRSTGMESLVLYEFRTRKLRPELSGNGRDLLFPLVAFE
ncbi:glucose dehydrogenase [Caerostris extrusa]|uniref:Glucose dehydrogenase n=1 Tax=Caerostris extrusa TaxID=172846 RepID=A0AAV4QTG4_CAEEX|nr:glucose dehydrogenase [Caerostris extrusa]